MAGTCSDKPFLYDTDYKISSVKKIPSYSVTMANILKAVLAGRATHESKDVNDRAARHCSFLTHSGTDLLESNLFSSLSLGTTL